MNGSLSHLVHSHRSWRFGLVFCIALLLLSLLAACGGDDDDAPANTPQSGSTATSEASTATVTDPSATATSSGDAPAPTATTTTPPLPSPATATATLPAATPTTAAETLTLSVYFLRDEKVATAHRVIPHTLQVAAAVMNELVKGPTEEETAAGLSTAIPVETELLSVTIDAGVATVDLSSEFESGGGSLSMGARLAQVVYTLTQFPTIESVLFTLEGEPVEVFGGEGLVLDGPVGRADFEDFTPAIFVESPVVGDEVSSPLRVWGTGNTFEAAFIVTLLGSDGEIIFEEPAMATSGTGTRGTFDLTFTWDTEVTGDGTLVVWESSAKDGEPINVVEIPVTIVE